MRPRPCARGRADARSAMTSGAGQSRGLSSSSLELTRHARRHADSESGPAGPLGLSPAGGDSKRPSPSLFSLSDAVVAGNPHPHIHLYTAAQEWMLLPP
jgi:hypothetical protein